MGFELQTNFTPQEKEFLKQLVRVTPKPFLNTVEEPLDREFRLLGIAALALSDYNNTPPFENFTISSMPPLMIPIIIMGTQYWIMAFRQAEFSLIDISYSDNGLSVNLDRTSKIGQAMENIEKLYLKVYENRKKVVLLANGGMGLETLRYNSNFSRFTAMLGTGGAFGWNMP